MPAPSKSKTDLWIFILLSLILFSLSFISFSNTLQNDFVFDDTTIVRDNDLIKSLKKIPEIFASDYWGDDTGKKTGLYRPLTLFTFAVNHHFSGLDPFPFHLTNVLIHSVNSILLFFFFLIIFRNTKGAFFCAVIFAIHPIHTEAVAGIVGRAELLSFFFIFVSFISFFYALAMRNFRFRAFPLFLLSFLSFLLALLSKEIAIAFAPALILILIYRERKLHNKNILQALLDYRWELLGVFTVLAFYLLIRVIVFGSLTGSSMPIFLDNPLAHVSLLERFSGASIVFIKYLWLLFCPLYLSADYSYNQIPIAGVSSFVGGGFSFLFLLALIALTVNLCRRKSDFFIPLSFFFAAVSVICNYFIITGTIMAERLLYIPSAALCIFLGMLFSPDADPLLKNKKRSPYYFLLFFAIALLAAPRTMLRNFDWKNEETLFKSTTETSPMSAKAHNNYGNALLDRGDLPQAEREFRMALKIYPDYSTTLSNLGTILERKGLLDDAMEKYRRAILLDPEFELAYFNLGNALQKKKDFRGALIAYRQAISIAPDHAEAFYNLGNLLALHSIFNGAVYHYKRAIEIRPDYFEAKNNLGLALKALDLRKKAEALSRRHEHGNADMRMIPQEMERRR